MGRERNCDQRMRLKAGSQWVASVQRMSAAPKDGRFRQERRFFSMA